MEYAARMEITTFSNNEIVGGLYWGLTSNEPQMPPEEMAKLMIEGLRRIKCPFTAIFWEMSMRNIELGSAPSYRSTR
jgi:hypothetical protein